MQLQRLQDREDDVRAVSSEALLPVVDLVAQQASQAASDVESALWALLQDVDDLSVSTGVPPLIQPPSLDTCPDKPAKCFPAHPNTGTQKARRSPYATLWCQSLS